MRALYFLFAILLLTSCGEDSPTEPVDTPDTPDVTTPENTEYPNVKYSSLENEAGSFDLFLKPDGNVELSYRFAPSNLDTVEALGTVRGKYKIKDEKYKIKFDSDERLDDLFGEKFVPDSLNVEVIDDLSISFDSARTSIYVYGTICIDEDRFSWAQAIKAN